MASTSMTAADLSTSFTSITASELRKLRNECSKGSSYQSAILSSGIITHVASLLQQQQQLWEHHGLLDDIIAVRRSAAQLLANLTVCNSVCQSAIWGQRREILLPLIPDDDIKTVEGIAMAVYNCVIDAPERLHECGEIVYKLICHQTSLIPEQSIWILHALAASGDLDVVLREAIAVPNDVMSVLSLLRDSESDEVVPLADGSIAAIANIFNGGSNTLFDHPQQLRMCARLLRDAAAADTAAELRISMHRHGIIRAAVDALRYVTEHVSRILPRKDGSLSVGVEEMPFYAVKCEIIALIAFAVYQCIQAQDEVASLDGALLLVLQSTNIDDLNPHIREYALVAIRNLAEDHAANQAAIAALERQGVAQHTVEELKDMGTEAEFDDVTGKLNLKTVSM